MDVQTCEMRFGKSYLIHSSLTFVGQIHIFVCFLRFLDLYRPRSRLKAQGRTSPARRNGVGSGSRRSGQKRDRLGRRRRFLVFFGITSFM